jgi:hypothetical protein
MMLAVRRFAVAAKSRRTSALPPTRGDQLAWSTISARPGICHALIAAPKLLVMVAGDQMRQAAADDLALRLERAADHLAASGMRPKRVSYGRLEATGLIKRRSPKGFVLDPVGPQLLLPDGRLWHYHTRRGPDGIYYDARVDHARAMHGPIPLGGARFSFLGAVLGKYNFGYRHHGGGVYELGAIIGTGGSPRFVDADDALSDVIDTL